MSRRAARLAAALAAGVLAAAQVAAQAQLLDFTAAERRAIADHGPWPPAAAADASNRWQADPAAVALGRRLFFDPGLSASGRVACASCHRPAMAFQDGRATAVGQGPGVRNTPGLLDAAGQRWYGWDGAADSLWAASVRPLLNPREMGASAASVAVRVRADPALAALATAAGDDESLLAAVGKALAAYQATLVSPRTVFDDFRDALLRGDAAAAARYPLAAQRGLRLFVGRARCALCHAGPRFTNGEFADIGVPFFVPGGVDPGRHGGLRALREDPFNRLGRHADDAGAGAVATRHVRLEHRHFGEFKVPGLRQLRHTAPYMHAGSHATLADVVRHYSELDEERLHADGERILQPLRLTGGEAADLLAFLGSLSEPGAATVKPCRAVGGPSQSPTSSYTGAMRLDFISDLACPWCAVGLHGLERGLQQLGDAFEVELHFQPYELNPDLGPEGRDVVEYLAAKYGKTREQIAQTQATIRERGAAVGFTVGERTRTWNTFDAHRLLHWGGLQGRQRALKHALLAAYHGQGRNPGAAEVLLDCALGVGLDADAARDVIVSGRYAHEVRAAERHWQQAGIRAVPSLVVDGKHLIQGGQPPEVYAQALSEIAAASQVLSATAASRPPGPR